MTEVAVASPASAVPAAREERTIRQILVGEEMKKQFALALPRMLTADRFVRVGLTALNKQPKLMECTPESFFSCMLDLAAWGIEPDGRRAHLIPFRDNKRGVMVCTLIMDWKGLVELGRRSGELALWRALLVCENDVFEYDKGQVVTHKIDFHKERGPVYAVYSYAKFKDGAEDFEVMTKREVDGIRARSKAGQSGPWVTDFNEMAKKTVIRRHSKRLPLSAEFRDAVDKDADQIDLERTEYQTREMNGKSRTENLVAKLTAPVPPLSPFAQAQAAPCPPCPSCEGGHVTPMAANAGADYFCADCGTKFNVHPDGMVEIVSLREQPAAELTKEAVDDMLGPETPEPAPETAPPPEPVVEKVCQMCGMPMTADAAGYTCPVTACGARHGDDGELLPPSRQPKQLRDK